MSDLRERLQELADMAARHGRTPGPQAAWRRARLRRLQLAAGTAALLAMALLASTVGVDRLAGPALLAPTATTRPSAITASTSSPGVSIVPDPGEIQRPVGSPPGAVGEQMVRDVAGAVAECKGSAPDRPTVLIAWGTGHGRTWLIAATPPRPGEERLCWADGLFEAGGAGGFSNNGSEPLTPLQASGSSNLRSGNQYWGHVVGPVVKHAARVQVLFDMGIPPLDLEPIQAGDRFPVNFYAGFYRLPGKDKRPATWQVVRVIAYDRGSRKIAECQAKPGPGHSC